MKTIQLLSIALLVAICILQTACKGPQGDVGPAGSAGATGAAGATGVAGPAGNANVVQINYAGRAVTGSFSLNLTGVDQNRLNNSVVFCYILSTGNLWYQLPGFTANGTFEYRVFTIGGSPSTLTVSRVTGGTGTDTFSNIRVLVVQASSVINGRKAAIDYSNYEEVKQYYNLVD